MMRHDKTGLLKAFLGGLPGPAAGRLAMAVEMDRLMDGHCLPHEDILSGLRPILRQEHPDRRPTPLRLFCRPFQDLLTSKPRTLKQKGAISRTSLIPVWTWVCQTLLPDEAQSFIRESKILVLATRLDDAVERAGQFWPLASQAIAKALSDQSARKAVQKIL